MSQHRIASLLQRLARLEGALRQKRAVPQLVLHPAGAPPVLPPRPDGLPWVLIPDNGRDAPR